jgi:hypothetical protein
LVFLEKVDRAKEPVFIGPDRMEAVLPEEDKRRFEGAYIFFKALKEPFKINILQRNIFLRPGIPIPIQEPIIEEVKPKYVVLNINRIGYSYEYRGYVEILKGVFRANISNVIGLRTFLAVGDSFSLKGEPEIVFKIEKITRERIIAMSNKREKLTLELNQPVQRGFFVTDIQIYATGEIFENKRVGDMIGQGKLVDIEENSVTIEIDGQKYQYNFRREDLPGMPAPAVPAPTIVPPGMEDFPGIPVLPWMEDLPGVPQR